MTTVKVELNGLSQLMGQLKDLGEDANQIILETITHLVIDTQEFAVDGITQGPKSGRVYTHYYFTDGTGNLRQGRERNKPHQASAPGQYPAADTGQLASNIRAIMPSSSNLTGEVGTAVKYGAYLEFGTSNMPDARPWLLPSFNRAKIGIEKELRAKMEARI